MNLVVASGGGAVVGAAAGAIWGAAHPDPWFGQGFNAVFYAAVGLPLGAVAALVLWAILALRVSRGLRRRAGSRRA